MRARDFKTFSSDNEDVNRVQDNVSDAIFPLITASLTGHILVSDIALVAGVPSQVSHKLGRAIKGWLPVAPNAAAQIFERARNKTTVTLEATADVTLSLLVF